jgi:hypothetical protein
MESKFVVKFSVKNGWPLAAISSPDLRGRQDFSAVNLLDSANRLFEQGEMHMLPFQAVVMIKTLRIDQCRAAFTVLRQNLFAVLALNLSAQFS